MAYYDSINTLKQALDQYSAEEERFNALYKTALENAAKEYERSAKQLEEQYKRDRNDVYTDTKREERNLFNTLASRGLGFSGEAAQAKLNSGITLANRLSEVTRGKNEGALQLELELADRKNSINSDKADRLGELYRDRNDLNLKIAQLESEKEQHDADLRAEKEMFEAELNAKYGDSESSSSSSGTVIGGVSGSDKDDKEEVVGYVPDITAKELAKQLVSSASGGGNSLNGSEKQAYSVNKYLLDLKENYSINSDYLQELIFVLKSLGYEGLSDADMRVQVISYEADEYYDEAYNEYYDEFALAGRNEVECRREARAAAHQKRLDFIYSRTKNSAEFTKCCKKLGISDADINKYIAGTKWYRPEVTEKEELKQSSGAGKHINTTVNMLK